MTHTRARARTAEAAQHHARTFSLTHVFWYLCWRRMHARTILYVDTRARARAGAWSGVLNLKSLVTLVLCSCCVLWSLEGLPFFS